MTSISGVEFSSAWEERIAADLDGLPVHFIGRQSLLRNKRAAGRAKDVADVEALAGTTPKGG